MMIEQIQRILILDELTLKKRKETRFDRSSIIRSKSQESYEVSDKSTISN